MQGALDNGWSRSQRTGSSATCPKADFLYWAYGLRNIFLREHRLSNRVYRVHQSACVAQPPRAGNQLVCGGLIVGLAKLILQGLEGRVPPVLSSMSANELYLVSFTMQLMGLRWFVVRRPMRSRWPLIAIGFVLAVYTALYLLRIPYIGNVINIPFVGLCGASAWILLKYGKGPFAAVSRVSAVVLLAEMSVAVTVQF